jgi:hypothetical protein
MQARYYLFIQNAWSLQPGTRNKPKPTAPKFGKDSRQLFDKNRSYDGPDWITSIMWISADVNVKDALLDLQMELECEHLQIQWKPAQKKYTNNQIVVYGLPPGFDPWGIMRELMYGLKESEKELCGAKRFSLEQNINQRDMALPLFIGYYKQSTPPKALTHSQSLENSLNKNKEFMQNGCRIFHLEYNPSENARMDTVWTHFIELGRSELVLGCHSKIFVLAASGLQNPTQITQVRRCMKFHIKYTTLSPIHSHATITNLNKWVEVSMTDPNTPPPRKFTTLCHEYMDLRTPEGLEVFHAVIPQVKSATRG